MSNRRDLSKLLSSESFPAHRQEALLIASEQDSLAPKFLAEYLILELKVFDYLLLLLAYGLTEYSEDHPKWLEKT